MIYLQIKSVNDIFYNVPPELLYIIMGCLSYEEVCYILHNAPTLKQYTKELGLINRNPIKGIYYAPSSPIISYIDTNQSLYRYIVCHLMKMPFPYTKSNHILFSQSCNMYTPDNLYEMMIEIVSHNDVELTKFFLVNVLQYIIDTVYHDNEDNSIISLLFNNNGMIFDNLAEFILKTNNYEMFNTIMKWLDNIDLNDMFEFVYYYMAIYGNNIEFIQYMMDNYVSNSIVDITDGVNDIIMQIPMDLITNQYNTYTDEMSLTMLETVFRQFNENNIIYIFDMKNILSYCIVNTYTDYLLSVFKITFHYSPNFIKEDLTIITDIILNDKYDIFINIIKYLRSYNFVYFKKTFIDYLKIACRNIPNVFNIKYIEFLLSFTYSELNNRFYNYCLTFSTIYANYDTIVWLCNKGANKHQESIELALKYMDTYNIVYNVELKRCIDYVKTYIKL